MDPARARREPQFGDLCHRWERRTSGRGLQGPLHSFGEKLVLMLPDVMMQMCCSAFIVQVTVGCRPLLTIVVCGGSTMLLDEGLAWGTTLRLIIQILHHPIQNVLP